MESVEVGANGRAVYLDYNASAPIRPEAADAIAEALGITGNASSVHGFGRTARRLIEDAREQVAALVNAKPEQVVFTSGGTEANNLAIRGCGRGSILISAGEHDSLRQAASDAEIIVLSPDGLVDLEGLAALLAGQRPPALVSVMLANNETGVIQPLRAVADLAKEKGALVHCDGIQAAGKIPIDMTELGVDLMSLSAHKLGGPQGVGALVVADGVTLTAQFSGGGQERRRRAGTENLPGIAGFGAAAQAALRDLDRAGQLREWRDELERRVAELAPAVQIFGISAPRLANTSCFTMPGVSAETQVIALDLAGVAVSAGAACSSGKLQPSHVLRAMGASEEDAGSAIRVSIGWQSRWSDLEHFLAAWAELYNRRAARVQIASSAA